jgi:DNA-binding MarR family transcriptional regulator
MASKKQPSHKIMSLDPNSKEGFGFAEYPIFFIGQIQRKNFKNLSVALKPFGLIPLEWRTLAQLQEEDGLSVSELAEIVISERSALSRLMGSMENKGLLKRIVSKKDQRETLVKLTKKGRQVFEEILPIVRKQLAWTLEGLSEEQQRELMLLLGKLYENVNRSPFA